MEYWGEKEASYSVVMVKCERTVSIVRIWNEFLSLQLSCIIYDDNRKGFGLCSTLR